MAAVCQSACLLGGRSVCRVVGWANGGFKSELALMDHGWVTTTKTGHHHHRLIEKGSVKSNQQCCYGSAIEIK